MSEIAKCAECGSPGQLIRYDYSPSLHWVSCYLGQMSGAHAPGSAGLWRTEREAVAAWNTYQERANEIKSAHEDALRHEGRADYFESLLTRLLATRQGRTVGYEPPEVQALWREVATVLEAKEGAK